MSARGRRRRASSRPGGDPGGFVFRTIESSSVVSSGSMTVHAFKPTSLGHDGVARGGDIAALPRSFARLSRGLQPGARGLSDVLRARSRSRALAPDARGDARAFVESGPRAVSRAESRGPCIDGASARALRAPRRARGVGVRVARLPADAPSRRASRATTAPSPSRARARARVPGRPRRALRACAADDGSRRADRDDAPGGGAPAAASDDASASLSLLAKAHFLARGDPPPRRRGRRGARALDASSDGIFPPTGSASPPATAAKFRRRVSATRALAADASAHLARGRHERAFASASAALRVARRAASLYLLRASRSPRPPRRRRRRRRGFPAPTPDVPKPPRRARRSPRPRRSARTTDALATAARVVRGLPEGRPGRGGVPRAHRERDPPARAPRERDGPRGGARVGRRRRRLRARLSRRREALRARAGGRVVPRGNRSRRGKPRVCSIPIPRGVMVVVSYSGRKTSEGTEAKKVLLPLNTYLLWRFRRRREPRRSLRFGGAGRRRRRWRRRRATASRGRARSGRRWRSRGTGWTAGGGAARPRQCRRRAERRREREARPRRRRAVPPRGRGGGGRRGRRRGGEGDGDDARVGPRLGPTRRLVFLSTFLRLFFWGANAGEPWAFPCTRPPPPRRRSSRTRAPRRGAARARGEGAGGGARAEGFVRGARRLTRDDASRPDWLAVLKRARTAGSR